MPDRAKAIAWRLKFESGAIDLWEAEDFIGVPGFGGWVTRWSPAAIPSTTVRSKPKSEPGRLRQGALQAGVKIGCAAWPVAR